MGINTYSCHSGCRREHMVAVRQRPHLAAFLERVAQLFEVVIFTASQKVRFCAPGCRARRMAESECCFSRALRAAPRSGRLPRRRPRRPPGSSAQGWRRHAALTVHSLDLLRFRLRAPILLQQMAQ